MLTAIITLYDYWLTLEGVNEPNPLFQMLVDDVNGLAHELSVLPTSDKQGRVTPASFFNQSTPFPEMFQAGFHLVTWRR
ncbi:hypothetical protein [Bradyrhizobium sp.]|uniref:hypothetical protein n=1 Tax=Bradyrhizobium sp. TaxID=376 RepID=UPI002F5408AD